MKLSVVLSVQPAGFEAVTFQGDLGGRSVAGRGSVWLLRPNGLLHLRLLSQRNTAHDRTRWAVNWNR